MVYLILALPFVIWGFKLVDYLYTILTRFHQYHALGQDSHKTENFYKRVDSIAHKTASQIERTDGHASELSTSEQIYVDNPLYSMLSRNPVDRAELGYG